jgi:hypothetical protein
MHALQVLDAHMTCVVYGNTGRRWWLEGG